MNAFTIKDIENLSGIKAHTIRIWEQRYSFLRPRRTDTNIRYYSNAELQIVLNIALLNRYGFKISHIDRMTREEIGEKVLSLTQAEAQHERIQNDLLHYMVEMQTEEFEMVLDRFISNRGIEQAILHIIFPFLERLGILWLTSHIQPAQEHLVSNIIRQKLIIGIENIRERPHHKSAMLFLPEGEHHELGLMYMHYLLKKKGVRVWYMGADTPLSDAVYVTEAKSPDFLYLHLTSVAHNFNLEKFLRNLYHQVPHTRVVISGRFAERYKKKLPPTVSLKRSLVEVMAFIATL